VPNCALIFFCRTGTEGSTEHWVSVPNCALIFFFKLRLRWKLSEKKLGGLSLSLRSKKSGLRRRLRYSVILCRGLNGSHWQKLFFRCFLELPLGMYNNSEFFDVFFDEFFDEFSKNFMTNFLTNFRRISWRISWQIFWRFFFDKFFDEFYDLQFLTIGSIRIGVPLILFIQKIFLPIVWVIKMELAILREGTLALPSWMLFHLGKKSCLFSTVSFRLIIPGEWWYTWDIFDNLYIFKHNIFFS
jgi:hypothetical protein